MRILLVGEDKALLEEMPQILPASGGELHMAKTRARAEKLLGQNEYDVILVLMILPDGDGRSLVRHIRRQWGYSAKCAIFAPAPHSGIEASALRAGADVFVALSADSRSIAAKVSPLFVEDHEQRMAARREPVTGFLRRNPFMSAFCKSAILAKQAGSTSILIFVHLDEYDEVLGQFGQEVADRIRKRVAQFVRERFPKTGLYGAWEDHQIIIAADSGDLVGITTALEGLKSDIFQAHFQKDSTTITEINATCTLTLVDTQDSPFRSVAKAEETLCRALAGPMGLVVSESDMDELGRHSVLLCSPNEEFAGQISRVLERALDVTYCPDRASAFSAGQVQEFGVAIVDTMTKGPSEDRTIGQLNMLGTFANVPIVALVGPGDRDGIVRATNQGADDVITLPAHDHELLEHVHLAVRQRTRLVMPTPTQDEIRARKAAVAVESPQPEPATPSQPVDPTPVAEPQVEAPSTPQIEVQTPAADTASNETDSDPKTAEIAASAAAALAAAALVPAAKEAIEDKTPTPPAEAPTPIEEPVAESPATPEPTPTPAPKPLEVETPAQAASSGDGEAGDTESREASAAFQPALSSHLSGVVGSLIKENLSKNERIEIPGLGTLSVTHQNSTVEEDAQGKTIHPPKRVITFEPKK